MSLYTAGYQGIDIEIFLQSLLDAGVNQVIDVRQYPISRKSGFSKTALSEKLAGVNIAYCHIRGLGCPKPVRDRYKQYGDWVRYEDDFLKHLEGQREALDRVATLSNVTRSCLICFEADAAFCHRRLVAEASQKIQPRIAIHHLAIQKPGTAL